MLCEWDTLWLKIHTVNLKKGANDWFQCWPKTLKGSMQWCGGLAFIYMRWYTKLWTFRRLLRYSLGYVFSGFGVSSSLGWERFFTGQFWPFTWKTSTVGKGKVNKWEFCKLKMTTIVVYVIVIQRIFPS